MAVQPFIRRGARSNATARRLVASSQQLAPSVLRTTVEDSGIHQPVMRCLALNDATMAGIHIDDATHFYLVASPKFAGRFYVAYNNKDGKWLVSSPDASIKAYCIRQVETYRKQLLARAAA